MEVGRKKRTGEALAHNNEGTLKTEITQLVREAGTHAPVETPGALHVSESAKPENETKETEKAATFTVSDEFKPPAPPSAGEIVEGVATSITEGAVEAVGVIGNESFSLGQEALTLATETLKETGAEALRTAETVGEIVESIVSPEEPTSEKNESREAPTLFEKVALTTQEIFASTLSAVGMFFNTFFNTIYNVLRLFWTSTVWLIRDVLVPAVTSAALRGWEIVKWVGATAYDRMEYVARFSKEALGSVVEGGKRAVLSAVNFFANLFRPHTSTEAHTSEQESQGGAGVSLVLGGLAVAAVGFGLVWFLGFLPF